MDNTIIETLYKAVKAYSSMDDDYIKDAARHGADSGFPGFTYYTDTVKFYEANKDEIWEMLYEDYEQLGHDNILQMIGDFGCADVTTHDEFANLLSWYALVLRGEDEE